ncbi:hypothetical protein F5144DRAFT_651733 [Chaetomium tenue]|uniref:Uncharacterized protein n=1 Tax=Chaetomium tenue TaxID=1854479 RepID=A0ACB7P3C1_9PEZI|nr:hypothetical protein F5144DRAFT_651733 [Chaetomium globosum]
MSPTINGEIGFPELVKGCGVGSTSDRLPPSQYNLVFDEEGDLWIKVSVGDGNKPDGEKILGLNDNDSDSDSDSDFDFYCDCDHDRDNDSYGDGYRDGYKDGYDEGHSVGHRDGHKAWEYNRKEILVGSGYDNGYKDGLNDGYSNGYNDGYSNGYNDGSSHGVDAGDSKCTDLETTFRFRVCSRAMRRASAVWSAMLFGPWREGKPVDGGEWVVTLDEDQPLPVAFLLAIIHGRSSLVPTWDVKTPGARAAISSILSTADKYDVVCLLRPFVSVFIPLAAVDGPVVKYDKLGTLHALNIAWHLGAAKLVVAVLQQIFFSLSEDKLSDLLTYAQGCPSMGMTVELWELLGVVRTHRETAIQSLLDYVYEKAKPRDNSHIEWNCKKTVLGGPALTAADGDKLPFLDPVATRELQEFREMQRRQCDSLMASQILYRLKTSYKGWETVPKQAKEVGEPAGMLMGRVSHSLDLQCSWGWSPHHAVFLQGHMDCLGGVHSEFKNFKSGGEFRNRWEIRLEPRPFELLRNRGELLGPREALATYYKLQKAGKCKDCRRP